MANFSRPGNPLMNAPSILLAWTFDPIWAVGLIGLAACGPAFPLAGPFLVSRPAASELLPPDNFLQGVTRESSATPRRKGNLVEVVLSDGEASVAGWVLDRSIGGLC